MRKIYLIILLAFSTTVNAQFKSLNDAINIAGKQRMLSQKITKAFLFVTAEVSVDRYQLELDESLSSFEENYQNLSEYIDKRYPKVKKELDIVESIWLSFREVASSEFSKTRSLYLLKSSEELLKATNKVVMKLEESQTVNKSRKLSRLVNKSGRQRMLSQKIAKYYIASYLDLSFEINLNFKDAIDLFDKSLFELASDKINTKQIQLKLDKVQRDWKFAKKSFDLNGRLKPATVGISLNFLLKDMNTITGLYSEISSEKSFSGN